jgi:hypothetical protein
MVGPSFLFLPYFLLLSVGLPSGRIRPGFCLPIVPGDSPRPSFVATYLARFIPPAFVDLSGQAVAPPCFGFIPFFPSISSCVFYCPRVALLRPRVGQRLRQPLCFSVLRPCAWFRVFFRGGRGKNRRREQARKWAGLPARPRWASQFFFLSFFGRGPGYVTRFSRDPRLLIPHLDGSTEYPQAT